MKRRETLAAARIVFGTLALIAIVTQLVVHVQHRLDVVNFFSYFTNLSNLFAAAVLLIGAVYLLQGREPTPRDDLVRGASVVGMALVGIVFGVLLRHVDLGTLLPWVNVVVHYVLPVVVVLDWLYQPPKSLLAFVQVRYWLVFPLLFFAYTLIRGAIVGWYPYPFFNPAHVGGYLGIALYGVAILILFLLIAWLLIFAANRLPRRVV
jgi:hypothetical protein